MATAHSDYKHGTMAVGAQSNTFSGFIKSSLYGAAFLVFFLLYPILAFCLPLTWPPALLISAVIGIILGVVLKLKGGWYGTVIGLSIFLVPVSMILAALTN